MQLELITPDKTVFAGEVSIVTLPGTNGSFQIQQDHAPMVSTLGKGLVSTGNESFMVDGGVVEILNNKILVLAEAVI